MLISETLEVDTYSCHEYEGAYVVMPKTDGLKKLPKGKYHLMISVQWDDNAACDPNNRRVLIKAHSPQALKLELVDAKTCSEVLTRLFEKHNAKNTKQCHLSLHPYSNFPIGYLAIKNDSQAHCDVQVDLKTENDSVTVLSDKCADQKMSVDLLP